MVLETQEPRDRVLGGGAQYTHMHTHWAVYDDGTGEEMTENKWESYKMLS